jgi:hypothetical protein
VAMTRKVDVGLGQHGQSARCIGVWQSYASEHTHGYSDVFGRNRLRLSS